MVSLGNMDASSVAVETHEYCIPKRAVLNMDDMNIWEKSEAYYEYLGFLTAMNEAVKGKTLQIECHLSEVTTGILQLLNKLDEWVTEIPPIEQPQRFGNKAFKTWYTRLKENSADLLREFLPEKFHRSICEIKEYLTEGFGNSTRIDYGTGHEMSFCMFLCCLFKIGAFLVADKVAVVCKVFNRYLQLARRLQIVYKMEPAGSRGVWSLDDYQFVPFIWGSSQLIDHPRIEPRSFLQEDILNMFSKDYMFLGCIQFISKVKTGPFAEHSNQLWNVSAVPYWSKVNQGLIKMYKAEVLAKFPVIQHVLFGSLLPFRVAHPPPVRSSITINPSSSRKSAPCVASSLTTPSLPAGLQLTSQSPVSSIHSSSVQPTAVNFKLPEETASEKGTEKTTNTQ